jgi:hypothetical protein
MILSAAARVAPAAQAFLQRDFFTEIQEFCSDEFCPKTGLF